MGIIVVLKCIYNYAPSFLVLYRCMVGVCVIMFFYTGKQ